MDNWQRSLNAWCMVKYNCRNIVDRLNGRDLMVDIEFRSVQAIGLSAHEKI